MSASSTVYATNTSDAPVQKVNLLTWIMVAALVAIIVFLVWKLISVEADHNTDVSMAAAQNSVNSIYNPNSLTLTQDGYYGTINGPGQPASFLGVQANSSAFPHQLKPNEPMLGQIRREKYNYRERISNRMNMTSYQYPNNNGWWPRASYTGQIRLEPGQWPKVSSEFSKPWTSEERPCGPNNPATYGGPDNSGVVVQAFGRMIRRGQCHNGRADCPMGMEAVGANCVGTAARDAFGNLIWSNSELSAPISQVANLADNEQKWEGSPLVSGGIGM